MQREVPTCPITVAIADDEPTIRGAVKELIESDSRFRLVGDAADAQGAIALSRMARPDVILVDLRMPGGGANAIAQIRDACRATRCIALTAYADRSSILSAVREGAAGYIVKGETAETVLSTIVAVHDGQTRLTPDVANTVVVELADQLKRQQRELDNKRHVRQYIDLAMGRGGMTVLFQPVQRLADRETIGYEALARLDAADQRSTKEWFEAAESIGLGRDLELAAADLAISNVEGLPPQCWLAVNLTPTYLENPQFGSLLTTASAPRLVVEITEHVPINDYGRIREELVAYRQRGGRVAVDDAGSGYSSLQHILELEPDFIKIDISLTRHIVTMAKQRAVITSLVALAEATNAVVIAEGIESAAQLAALRDLGVTHGQGFYLGRPAALQQQVGIA